MRNILTLLMAAVTVVVMMAPEDADARRFGGGRSFGKSPSYSRQATPPPTRQAAPSRQQTAPAQGGRSGASRWLGPLAGLAAGGLLAAMLFGDGFEGMQFLDILLIGGLIFGGFMLFRHLRRRATPQPQRYAAAGPAGGFRVPEIGEGLGGGGGEAPASPPDWFDADGFVQGAKSHFLALQKAWDEGDMEQIRDYCAPELFAELSRERDALPGRQYTEVVTLDARLEGIAYEGDLLYAGVRFTGLVREAPDARPEPIDETWHVRHPAHTPKGDWHLAGIQQN